MEVDRVVVLLSVDGAPPANALTRIGSGTRPVSLFTIRTFPSIFWIGTSEYPNNTKIQPKMNAIK